MAKTAAATPPTRASADAVLPFVPPADGGMPDPTCACVPTSVVQLSEIVAPGTVRPLLVNCVESCAATPVGPLKTPVGIGGGEAK